MLTTIHTARTKGEYKDMNNKVRARQETLDKFLKQWDVSESICKLCLIKDSFALSATITQISI